MLDDLPALAWGEIPARRGVKGASRADTQPPMPIAVLIVGGEAQAALAENTISGARALECEQTNNVDTAIDLARTLAPDILVIDVDLPGAPELAEAVLADPLTDPLPVVVLGTFRLPEEIARFDALGVARTLAKPVTPEQFRATCDEIIEIREGRTVRMTLGEPTLEQLAEKLADELKHALLDSVDRPTRSQRLPLGEGTEVLGALWGAIARVQEIVMQKTGGTIRFGGHAPEGAIALAPSLQQDVPGAERLHGRGRGAAADVRLNGRRVVVADDDPGVTWFISDLLRTAGCEVHEALDGATALDLAFRVQPELVVSDILMPRLDGFGLCRALHRDVALRDTPVILLSWKEDLLQRVRELGASAAAYMRKESGSRTILARVREVLWPRARVEARLRGEGEVRGRLDGLTPRLLLELICLIRKDGRFCVSDATHLYEVEIRSGSPRKATRTASDGSFLSGERALASLLGVSAGRFAVTTNSEPVRGELTGTLFDQLVRPIAAARGALAATVGARMASVEHVIFDEKSIEDYLRATPEPTASLIKRLAQGTAPRRLLLEGDAPASLLEDVLSDLAARAAIQAVVGAQGADLLSPAVDAALAVLGRAAEPRRAMPPNARLSTPVPAPAVAVEAPRNDSVAVDSPPEDDIETYDGLILSEPPPAEAEGIDAPPSSLEDAVMRELSGRSLQPRSSRASVPDPPPIVEPSQLRARSSNPPTATGDSDPLLPSIPPDAIVPAASISEDMLVAPQPPAAEPPRASAASAGNAPDATLRTADTARPARAAADAGTAAPKPRGWALLLALALVGLAVVAALRASRMEQEPPYVAPEPAALAASTAAPVTTSSEHAAAAPNPTPSGDDDLPPGAEVAPGFGLVQVHAPARAVVRIDGAIAGVGPFVASVAPPGYHEVRVEQGGRASTHVIEVRAGKATQVKSVSLP
jgi:CheY-like chemotaxis protein